MRLSKRVTDLETKRGGPNSLGHLTDEELEAHAFDLIHQFEAAGVVLPNDWRAQYEHSSIRFLQWLEAQAKEAITCLEID